MLHAGTEDELTVSENKQQPGLETNKSASPNNSQNTQASVSNDDVLTPQDRESVASRLREYALENPGSALSICVLTFGGLLLLVYFLRIGFLPDIALESATTLLYAVSILGLFILVIFAAYLVMPAFVAKAMWQDYQEQGKLSVTWVFGLSGGAAFFAWPISFFSIIVLEKSAEQSLFISLGTVILTVFLSACFMASRKSEPKSKSVKEDADEQPKAGGHPIWVALRVAATAFIQWALLCIVFLMVVGLGRDGVLRKAEWPALFVVLLPLLFSAVIPLMVQKLTWSQSVRLTLGLGPVLLFVLLLLTESFSKPSALVISKLGAGEFEATRLVLSGKGCKQLNLALGGEHCVEVKDDEPTPLCPVALRSRIGGQILIEVAPVTLKNGKLAWDERRSAKGEVIPRRRVVLDKSALLAWSTLVPLEIAVASAASSSASPKAASSIYVDASKVLITQGKQAETVLRVTTNPQNKRPVAASTASSVSTASAPSLTRTTELETSLLELCGKPR